MGIFIFHHYTGTNLASRHSLSRLAMLALCTVFLLAATLLPAQEYIPGPPQPPSETTTAPPGPLTTLHGIVLNAATGSPLPRALVRIEGDADTGALTDGEGRFEIPGVPVGPQAVLVIKPGFLDQAFFPGGDMSIDYLPGINHSILVADKMPDLIFSMAPTNAIHGRILLSTGDPAQGIGITLVKRTVEHGRAAWKAISTVKANSEGAYRFARLGLGNGEYAIYSEPAIDSELANLLSVTGSDGEGSHNGFPSQFYPEAHDLAGTAKIHLAGGQDTEINLSLTLQPFHTVSAQATLPSGKHYGDQNPAWEGMALSAEVLDAQGHLLPYTARYDEAAHTLQALLPDGIYAFQVTVTLSRFTASMAGNNTFTPAMDSAPLTGQVEFSVAGHDVANLRIPLLAQRANYVQVTMIRSNAPPTPNNSESGAFSVVLSEAGDSISNGMVSVYATGSGPGQLETTFTLSGSYWADTMISQHGLCLASFTAGSANLAHEPLVVGPAGVTAPLTLALSNDCASLKLTLPTAGAALEPGEEPWYTVYVVPDFETTENIEPQTLRPSSGGTITMEGLTPGNYHVYTFAASAVLEYHNPAALAALPTSGQAVTLSAGSTSTLVLEVPAR